MSNKEFETEIETMDEVVNYVDDLPVYKHNSMWYMIVSGMLVPIIDSLATPYYKTKMIEAQERIANNQMVANERKCYNILKTIEELGTRSNLPVSLKEEIIKSLMEEFRKLNK